MFDLIPGTDIVNHKDMVEILREYNQLNKYAIYGKEKYTITELMFLAIQHSDISRLKQCIDFGANINTIYSQNNMMFETTPLIESIYSKNKKIFVYVLNHKNIDVNLELHGHITPPFRTCLMLSLFDFANILLQKEEFILTELDINQILKYKKTYLPQLILPPRIKMLMV